MKKRVIIGKPPKAFVGMAMMAGQAAMSIANGIKAKKEAKKAEIAAQQSALTQQRSSDQLELDEYPEEGVEDVSYYQAGGGKLGVKKRTPDPTDKELGKTEVKEVNQATGVPFTSEGANQLFGRVPQGEGVYAPINYGKYKDVGYFETGNVTGDTVRIRNTKANPHNIDTINPLMNDLRKLNPGRKLELEYKAGGGTVKAGASHNTLGGKLNPISSDMELASGNTHESSKIDGTSGIKLIQGNKAIAEIENDETVKDGDLVYSDRLKASNGKTFAENAEKLARQKGKAEKRMGVGDSISRATTERRVGMIDQAENALFIEQEEFKKANGIEQGDSVPKAAWGAALGKAAGKIAPYADNIANAAVSMFMTPKVSKPSYIKARQLDTNVNVNPQLNAVSDAVNSTTDSIMSNTSNSNTARNNIASVKLRGADQTAGILANKENRETSLKNQNSQFQLQTDLMNSQKRDQYNRDNTARQGHIKSEISQNFANLSGDLVDAENNKRDEAYNKEALDAFKVAYGKNGIVERSDEELEKLFRMMPAQRRTNAVGGKIKVRKRK